MSEDQAPDRKLGKANKSLEVPKRSQKRSMVISDIERGYIKQIAEKAKNMRIAKNMSYEQFALQVGINRNSYYRFEQSASSGDNYTVALLLKVITGLDATLPEFFKDIR